MGIRFFPALFLSLLTANFNTTWAQNSFGAQPAFWDRHAKLEALEDIKNSSLQNFFQRVQGFSADESILNFVTQLFQTFKIDVEPVYVIAGKSPFCQGEGGVIGTKLEEIWVVCFEKRRLSSIRLGWRVKDLEKAKDYERMIARGRSLLMYTAEQSEPERDVVAIVKGMQEVFLVKKNNDRFSIVSVSHVN